MNASKNFSYKNQYERLLSRERNIGVPVDSVHISLQEKIREENMKHFSDTYANRPIGVHGIDLPRFSDNLKEYWKASTPVQTRQSSVKKLQIIKKPCDPIPLTSRSDFANEKKTGKAKAEKPLMLKPTQIEHSEPSPNKDHMRNSRWTNYHYNFIRKDPVSDTIYTKSTTPDVKTKLLEVKTPKSLIVKRMQNRGNFSPVKDILRSTGFS